MNIEYIHTHKIAIKVEHEYQRKYNNTVLNKLQVNAGIAIPTPVLLYQH